MTETDRAAPSLSERLATLSPAKQALLARRLAERRSAGEGQADRIAPRDPDARISTSSGTCISKSE